MNTSPQPTPTPPQPDFDPESSADQKTLLAKCLRPSQDNEAHSGEGMASILRRLQ